MTVIFDRRTLLKRSAIGGSFLLLGCKTVGGRSTLAEDNGAASDSSNLRVRRRWEPGQDSDFKKQYAQAIDWLKANDQQTFPDTDPRSYLTWKKFVDLHNSSCPHGNWLFVPWHRLYLYYFETACQMALQDTNFALPYWDWTLDPTFPDEFFTVPTLTVDNRKIKQGTNMPVEYTGQKIMDHIYAITDFYAFFSRPTDYVPPFRGPAGTSGAATGAFENNPHNNVHKFIGGWMSANESPNDPIFWMHHGNVDRIWHQFQRLNPNLKPTKVVSILKGGSAIAARDDVADVYMATELKMHRAGDVEQPTLVWTEQNRTVPSKLTVKDVQDTKTFGYIYDTDSQPPPAIVPETSGLKVNNGISQKMVVRTGTRYGYAMIGTSTPAANRITTTIDVTDKDSKNLLSALKSSKQDYAYFVAGNLVPPTDARMKDALLIRFFLFTGNNFANYDFFSEDAYTRPEYVGVYSFFGADHVHAGQAAGAPKATTVEFSDIFRKKLGSSEVKTLTLVAAAMDIRTREPLDYFSFSPKTELALEFHSAANIQGK